MMFFFSLQGNTFTFIFIFGCLLASSLAQSSAEEEVEDLTDDLTSMESQRSARFLRWPSLSKNPNKFRIKKRLGPYPGPMPIPTLDPSIPKNRLHVKQPVLLAKRPMRPQYEGGLRSNRMIYKKVARKGPLTGKLPPKGPVPTPRRPASSSRRPPRKLPLPLPPLGLKSPKSPARVIYKKQLKHKTPLIKKNPIHKKPQRSKNKKVIPAKALKEKLVTKKLNNRLVPVLTPAGPVATKHQKKQGVAQADDRFFFPARGKRRPRPSKKKPKKRPSKYRRPKPKPQTIYKPKPTAKKPKKPKTTKAPAYRPVAHNTETPDIEVTSYKPPKDVFKQSSDAISSDDFPEFSKPDFPDLSSDFMPNFDFEINKINCELANLF